MTNEELIKNLEEYDKEVNRLFKENKKLKEIINKAIEYVSLFWEESDIAIYDSEDDTYLEDNNAISKLLNILKGE